MSKLKFEPRKWHNCPKKEWKTCTEGVNCYSYILNNPHFFWSVPGFGFAHEEGQKYVGSFNNYFEKMTLKQFRKSLIEGAINDGLIKINSSEEEKKEYHLAALFFPKGDKDFHWYRKDDNGFWSHKDGWEPAVNKNKQNDLIIDPIEDAKPLYPIFGGYFLVPRKGITIKQTFIKKSYGI
jgi:hypothetical protein